MAAATEDWPAVADAIQTRMTEIGMTQATLVERSGVSKATVAELQYNKRQRHRADHILRAVSEALELHPEHLRSLAAGTRLQPVDEPPIRAPEDIPGNLAAIHHSLDKLSHRLDEFITSVNTRLDTLQSTVEVNFPKPPPS